MGRTREGTSWAAKAEGGRWGNVKKTGKLIPKYQVFKRLQRDQQGRQATWPKKPAADWLRDVGSGNTGLHWVSPCRPSSSYVGIAAGPSSRRSRKTRQLAEILADFCNRRALHTTNSLSEACLPCPFLPLSLQAGSFHLVPAADREQWQ